MNLETLTGRQAHMLSLIERYLDKYDYPPTMEELRKMARLNSTATVHQHVKELQRKGYISAKDGRRRAMALDESVRGVPLIGRVAAGTAIEAIENVERYVEIPPGLLKKRPDYLLRVVGDSMIESGIHDGDWIAVRKADTADPGSIVIAMRDGDVTVKELAIENGEVVLKPHNRAMKPIRIPPDQVSIMGVYMGSLLRPS